ncbi:MAG: tetratricopeptide repeat protein [Candidatus Eisenbacteria bacterium]|nr:tetratricopeptide repeat protein [Candidatus Eisenbacteria bacterium]
MNDGKPRNRILAMAEWAETLPISMGRWLLLLAAIVVLRHFLEQLSGQSRTLYFLSYFLHYPLAYVAPLLALSVLLAAAAREKVERVTRLMLFAWLLTLLPPLIDLVVHSAAEAPQLIGYLIPRDSSLGDAFLNLLNPAYQRFQGTTTGIRVEAGLGCLLGAYYVFLKTRSAGRAVVSFFAVYVTMFFFFALPPITLAVARLLGSEAENVYVLFFSKADVHRAFVNATPFAVSDLSNALIDIIVIVPVLALWYRLYDRERFSGLMRGLNPIRIVFHVGAVVLGAALGARLLLDSPGVFSISQFFDAISLLGLAAAAFFTAASAGAMDALGRAGEAGDAPRTAASVHDIRLRAAFFFSLACLFALSVSYVALTYVLAALSAWYIYHSSPFRLARFPLLGGFVAGGALLFMLSMGYSAYAGASASLWMPGSLTALALFVPTLSLLARDVWTQRRDRFSLCALAGATRCRVIAGGGVLLSCLLPGALLTMPALLIPGVIVGGAGFGLLVKGSGRTIPPGLALLAVILTTAALVMGAHEAPVLSAQLQATSFSEMSRREGNFALSERDPDLPTGMDEGLRLFEEGDYEGAASAFRRVLERDPENADAYVSIGSAYLRLERLSEAARAFRKALDLEPDNARAHVGLGQTFQFYGDFDSAFEELTTALELAPDDPNLVHAMAGFFKAAGDPEQEANALERMLELDPDRPRVYSRLADIYMAAGMYDRAIETLNRATTADAEPEHLHTQLAQAYYLSGDLDAAERETRREIEKHPGRASPHAVLAGLLAERGDVEEARAEYREAISLTGDAILRERLERELSKLGE